uniref:uncharacterized protein LOC118152976 n=1 Tax=Callithrix jacchus TaxID=9483 RepID=UPI00159E5011|nr:uncharacterized protein LOC118152976 [Callithrix jacchus]
MLHRSPNFSRPYHCPGRLQSYTAEYAISWGNVHTDTAARSLTNVKLTPTPVLFLTMATQPVYLPSEKQALIQKWGTESNQFWIFLNNRITLPWEQAPKITAEIHQSLHIGPKALHCFVQPLFFSPGLQQTIEQVHKACVTCSKASPQGGLRPQFPTHQLQGNLPAQDWQIDFTHMPTHKKLCYLLTFVDTFSGWIEAFSTSREAADMVSSLLTQEIIPCFSLPATIQSDNGPAFMAQVVQLVAKSLNISWKLHIPYHPQSLGKVEWAHGILKDHLAKLAIEVKSLGPHSYLLPWPGSGPLHGGQRALVPLTCCMASLFWCLIISL